MGVERMWYKMQDALHLRVKALDGVLLHLCCWAATCVVWRLGQLIHNLYHASLELCIH